MLTKKRPETIPATLTFTGQGVSEEKLNIVYHNRKQSEVVTAFTEAAGDIRKIILYLVKSWECRFDLTFDGLTEMEDELPGALDGILDGFHKARAVALEKN